MLSLKGVSAGYTGMPVLRGVSLDVQPREIVALVGSNGAGKTTLLRALSRVIPCTGTVLFNGRDLVAMTSDQAFAAGLVQVPEGRQLFDRMTVEDNLLMGAYRRRRRPRSRAIWTACIRCSLGSASEESSWPAACPEGNSKCAQWRGL